MARLCRSRTCDLPVYDQMLTTGRIGWEAGIRTLRPRVPNSLMARDFWRQASQGQSVARSLMFAAVTSTPLESTRVVETSLTTSIVSRHTAAVQAAGAGSHKRQAGGGGRAWSGERRSVSTPPRSELPHRLSTVVPTKHLFGHCGP